LRLVDVSLAAELTFTEPWRSGIKETYPYYEVYIPVKGYNGLDFSVNKDIKTWRGNGCPRLQGNGSQTNKCWSHPRSSQEEEPLPP